MSFSFKLLSHYGDKFPDGRLLANHLKGVADIAVKTHRMHGVNSDLEQIIKTICLCHDFGKASSYFQRYLKNAYNGELKNHGEISAYFAYHMLPEEYKLTGFICVKRHHGDMDNALDLFSYDEDNLLKIAKDTEKNITELNAIYETDISGFFRKMEDERFLREPMRAFKKMSGKFKAEDLLLLQYLWSLLLTGDKTELIRGSAYENKTDFQEKHIKNYKENIRKKLLSDSPEIEKTKLFSIRESIYNQIIESIDKIDINKHHKFSINVPTGTGKTLGVYGAAFRLMERIFAESGENIRPSLVYAIPFTSIIDQNYDVLENIMDLNEINKYEDTILKHHSMTELKYRSSEHDEYRDYDARFCVENWQSTIITTTFVQIFNTLFKTGINSIGSRFHKLAGSIIILDEVQAIDPKYFKIIEAYFDILCEKFNAYVITVTATKPMFLEGLELVEDNKRFFDELNRIQIENHTGEAIALDTFCEIVAEDIRFNPNKSFLIVLNTVKSSLEAAEYLEAHCEGREVLYLSTEIYPKRRLEIIRRIKSEKRTKFIVVSTQLIEAGVDVDFDIVYRDFSTIDSINQTAGRANRNGLNEKGIVKLYALMNKNDRDKKYSSYIYPLPLLHATKQIIEGKSVIDENQIFDINNQYFQKLNQIKSDNQSEDIEQAIKRLNFKEIRGKFELIPQDYAKEDIIININEESQECIDKIQKGSLSYQEMINCWRKLNQYKVSVSKKDLDMINDKTIEAGNLRILESDYYDINRGIKRIKSLTF